jgi:PIN domain nuclease of toxin-antitoxin system
MDYLFDTNIFLEILPGQEKKETCKKILADYKRTIFLSDFSVHSIGVILFKQKIFSYVAKALSI